LDVDAQVITVNGTQAPYADQFAWVQAVGAAYLPAVVAAGSPPTACRSASRSPSPTCATAP